MTCIRCMQMSFVEPPTLEDAVTALNEWQKVLSDTFHQVENLMRGNGAIEGQGLVQESAEAKENSGGPIYPSVIAAELRRAWQSERQARAENAIMRQRIAFLTSENLVRMQEDVELRRELQMARAVSEPTVLQLRQLMLEPAVNAEFSRMAAVAEAARNEAAKLKHDMLMLYASAANDPKGPRAAAAQIRELEEKCEKLKELTSNSRVATLENSLEVAQSQLEEMRKQYGGAYFFFVVAVFLF